MSKPKIAVFSGPNATICNTPTLVTGNKGRRRGERMLDGPHDPLVAQRLHEPVKVKIRKFSAHPLEDDARDVYIDDGKDYWEVELRPEDGPYLLPYVARRADGSTEGRPFEEADLFDAELNFGGRQFFFPDASRQFENIDHTLSGRDENGAANILNRKAGYDFIRALPSSGYTRQGERPGEDYFYYKPFPLLQFPRNRDLARVANAVQTALDSGSYIGGIWLDGSPTVEEAMYWLNLLIDTELPLAGVAAQRPHGQLGNDGDRNIVDAVDYILSGQGTGLGAVGIQEERIFAARDYKKADDRPGNYKVTGGAGGILGNIGPPVRIWYRPVYRHTAQSELNLSRLPERVEFLDRAGDAEATTIRVKSSDGALRWQCIPHVHIVKYGAYMDVDNTSNPDHEVDILARIDRGLAEERASGEDGPPFHGFVLEGLSPYGVGSNSQREALAIAAFSGMPVVSVGRADTGGPVPPGMSRYMIAGNNLDTNKARILLMAAMLKLGRLPKARNPRNPTLSEQEALLEAMAAFQRVFDSH